MFFVFWLEFFLAVILLGAFLPVLALLFGKQSMVQYRLTAFVCRLVLMFSGIRIKIKGGENILQVAVDKGLIITANHSSFLDFFAMQRAMPAPVKFAVWWIGFKVPFLRNVYKELGYIAVGRKEVLSFQKVYEGLKAGQRYIVLSNPSFGVEDNIHYGDALVMAANLAECQIVPVAIKNAGKTLPFTHWKRLMPGKIIVNIGTPAAFQTTTELVAAIETLYQEA
jgi:1-acyl-sn-glycerol-3-phosphate acyltransferase